MNFYEVIVGNIGTVHTGRNHRDAWTRAQDYIAQSKTNRGRAGGEDVTILRNGEILEEYIGSLSREVEM